MTTLNNNRAVLGGAAPDIRARVIVEFDLLGCDGVGIENPQRGGCVTRIDRTRGQIQPQGLEEIAAGLAFQCQAALVDGVDTCDHVEGHLVDIFHHFDRCQIGG